MNLEVVNFKRCKCGFACPITWVIIVHESGLHFHECASQHLYFKLELQEGHFIEPLAVQHEELTNEDLMELEAQRKDKKRQEEEEVTEELKKLLMLEMARFSVFEEALLVIEAQNPNVEWYTKVTAAIQYPIQLYHVIYDTKKSYHPGITGLFCQEGR